MDSLCFDGDYIVVGAVVAAVETLTEVCALVEVSLLSEIEATV